MKTAVINVKVHPQTKQKAKKLAEELGFSLGSVVNGFLREFVRNRRIDFQVEELSDFAIRELQESEEDIKAGRVHSFKNANEAVAFLDDIMKQGYAG